MHENGPGPSLKPSTASPSISTHPITSSVPRPFLRWAGGKQLLLARLLQFLPADLGDRVYHEPFVGAGTLFFSICPQIAFLSDLNEHLLDCYSFVRDQPKAVATQLRRYATADSEEHYYTIRDVYNRSNFNAAQAARFIYLNRTCFNGIFRVNRSGAFNVPYGFKEAPRYPSLADLIAVGKCLQRATIKKSHFTHSLARCGKGDFVYLDPPYPPLNGTSYFAHYTLDRFDEKEQRLLAAQAKEASARGAKIMMTNANTGLIRELYHGWNKGRLRVTRYVTCKRVKHKVEELVLTNYP